MDYNNILTQYEDSSSLGLENGRCGLVLSSFLLSEKDERYKEKTFIHLDYLLDHVYESTSLSFNEGLMGIGWMLEFLTQNQYISNSCDSLLHEIDDIIYKWVNFHQLDSFSLNNGYIGTLLYFCYRLRGDRILSPNRELALKECTVKILGKLYAEAKKQTNARFTETGWRQLHVLTGIFRKLNIQNHITTDLLRITQNMVKQGNYICQQQKDVTLINIIHSLSDTSKKYKILKNFFT